MKKIISFFLIFGGILELFSQTKPASPAGRGASPIITPNSSHITNSTYAVVIGISDYQDINIPDLRYADKDAEAFANFLRSPAGGSLDVDHLKVLTNNQATAGRIAEALDALVEQVKKDENVIIYFSGHGDVERKTVSQPGFLLAWDAPSKVYMGGGTYSLSFLQEIVTTLSTQNMAKVRVITDACHAGKLSGNQIGGSQLTSVNLARQYANEVKILSCQPNEYSLEGAQWGGGRGLFSYHLVDGLFGLADNNNDGQITLGEIDRYLEDHVSSEAAPQSQVPILIGNKTDRLAIVNVPILADLKKNKAGNTALFVSTETRGFEEEILLKADTNIRKIYKDFKKAISEKRFLTPDTNCAETYYTHLEQFEILIPLKGLMKRNYAAALQDESQQILNEWVQTKQEQSITNISNIGNNNLPKKAFTEKISKFPKCLDRAAELLGKSHYLYKILKARQYFFEGYLMANADKNPNSILGESALRLFQKSLDFQPEQPQVYWQMSKVFGFNLLQSDSLEYYARLAIEIYPHWVKPCAEAVYILCYKFHQLDRAKLLLQQLNGLDTNSSEVLQIWAYVNYQLQLFSEAEKQLLKAISLDSTNGVLWGNLGHLYNQTLRNLEAETALTHAIYLDSTNTVYWNNLGSSYIRRKKYKEAELVLKKAIYLDSINVYAWGNLGALYCQTNRFALAEPILKKAITIDSTNIYPWNNLGDLYNQTGRFKEAEFVLKKAISIDSSIASNFNNLGFPYLRTKRYAEAEMAFKKAISLDSSNVIFWNNLGLTFLQNKNYQEALKVLKNAIALDSTFANPRKHLGMVYFKTNRPEEARQHFLKAIELNQNYGGAILGMAYIFFSEEKPEEAFGYVDQAIEKGV
ncbi:MAG: tetratricopeptide repeat protein, partial [Saprospiraceae bacterium]